MLKQKRVLKLCLGLLAFGITVSFSNLNRFGYFKNMVKAMEDVPASGLQIYKQNKENVKNVNGCYVRYPSENSVWPGGYGYCYLDFSVFNSDEQKKKQLEYLLSRTNCISLDLGVSPGNVDAEVLRTPWLLSDNHRETGLIDMYREYFSGYINDMRELLVKGKDDKLIKLLDELAYLEINGRLFKYNELVNSLSASVKGKRYYDFSNVENNKMLYKEIVSVVKYLSDLALRLKEALKAKGMWYYNVLGKIKASTFSNYKDFRNLEDLNCISEFVGEERFLLNGWIKHLAYIGAFLEKFFKLGNVFYQEENDKYAKYEYYWDFVIGKLYDNFHPFFSRFKDGCTRIDINISYDDKYSKLLLDIVNSDSKSCLLSYRVPINENVESNVFDFLVAIKKLVAKCLLEQDPELTREDLLKQDSKLSEGEKEKKLISLKEKKEAIISLLDKSIVVKDNSNKLNINNIHMDKDVLGQIVEDVINETKEITKIKDIVHYAVVDEVNKFVGEIKNKVFKDGLETPYDKLPYDKLKDAFNAVLEDLAREIGCHPVPLELFEDIYKKINSEFKKQNIDELELDKVTYLTGNSYLRVGASKIRHLVGLALEDVVADNSINL